MHFVTVYNFPSEQNPAVLRLLCDADVPSMSLAPLTLHGRDATVLTALRTQFCRKFNVADASARPDARAAADLAATRSRIADLVASVLAIESTAVPLYTPLRQLGVDSFLVTELTELLANEFHVQLAASFLFSYTTVAAVAAFVCEQQQPASRAVEAAAPTSGPSSTRAAHGTAIVGVACRLPGPSAATPCSSVDELGAALTSGTNCIGACAPPRKPQFVSRDRKSTRLNSSH